MQDLLTAHIEKAKNHGDKVKKMQVHVFEHNKVVILNNKIMGFTIKKSFTSDNPKVLDFFPYNTILLMEKELN